MKPQKLSSLGSRSYPCSRLGWNLEQNLTRMKQCWSWRKKIPERCQVYKEVGEEEEVEEICVEAKDINDSCRGCSCGKSTLSLCLLRHPSSLKFYVRSGGKRCEAILPGPSSHCPMFACALFLGKLTICQFPACLSSADQENNTVRWATQGWLSLFLID